MGTMQGGPWHQQATDTVSIEIDADRLGLLSFKTRAGHGQFYIDRDYIDTFIVKLLAAANGNEEETT